MAKSAIGRDIELLGFNLETHHSSAYSAGMHNMKKEGGTNDACSEVAIGTTRRTRALVSSSKPPGGRVGGTLFGFRASGSSTFDVDLTVNRSPSCWCIFRVTQFLWLK